MQNTTGLLGIKLMYARPYSPESKGKSEVFHHQVDRFLAEIKLENVTTLDELNNLYQVWLTECYQHRPHSALKGNRSPYEAFQSDKRPIRYADPQESTLRGGPAVSGDESYRHLRSCRYIRHHRSRRQPVAVQAKERVIGPSGQVLSPSLPDTWMCGNRVRFESRRKKHQERTSPCSSATEGR